MIPYTVEGSIIVTCGVILGVFDPKAAIELGQNTFLTLPYLAAYNVLNKDVILICCVLRGSTYPLADNNAARLYNYDGLCLSINLYSSSLFKIFNF